jgi:transforming growth factor-beta-induced protein
MRSLPTARRFAAPRFAAPRSLALALALAAVGVAGCDDDPNGVEPSEPTVAEAAASTAQLSTLVTALTAAGLVPTLNGTGPFTVFAPVNSAFDALPAGMLARLLETGNREILTKLLTFHVVPGRITAAQLQNGQTLTTVEGTTLPVTVANGVVTVSGARVTTADVNASNGVVHLIDGVLLGSLDVVDQAVVRGFSALVSAVTTAGLVSALRGGTLTVFAPTNAAFAAIPGGAPTTLAGLTPVLQLHVVGSRALSSQLTAGRQLPTPAGLTPVLQLHVVGSRALSSQLTAGRQLPTLLTGTSLTVSLTNGVRVTGPRNSAAVTTADIVAKNGVIHVVDTVLLP